jgi:NADH-quinone oxidoreductase subunit C
MSNTAINFKNYLKESGFDLNLSIFMHEQNCVNIILNDATKIKEFALFLNKGDFVIDTLLDICGVDYLGQEDKRFEVVYHFLSVKKNVRARVKVRLNDGEKIDSLDSVFLSANWYERETFDMYGIEFVGHPDLRRILTDYGFEGYPLRKDFPLSGHVQVKYDIETKSVINEPVELMQAYRDFDFSMPFDGIKKECAKILSEQE